MHPTFKTTKLSHSLLLVFFIVSFLGLGQGANLKYNQVITESGVVTFPFSGPNPTFTITVPVGRVWKIEAATVYPDGMIKINDLLAVRVQNTGNWSYFPMWLKAGTYTLSLTPLASTCCGPWTLSYGYSAIEFLEVP